MVYKQRPEGHVRICSEKYKNEVKMFYAERPKYVESKWEKNHGLSNK